MLANDVKEPLSPGRTLHTTEDLLLLIKVYDLQGKHEEALAVLDRPATSIHSQIGGHSWELVRSRIDLLHTLYLWKDEWQFCWELLQDARPDVLRNSSRTPYSSFGEIGDDWKVWSGLIEATARLDSTECVVLPVRHRTVSGKLTIPDTKIARR